MAKRKARLTDIHEVAMDLPDVTHTESGFGDPAYQVHGRTFVFFRRPRKDAVDEETGEQLTDVICFSVADAEDKAALVQSSSPWFTTPHFTGYNAVLLREAHLGRLTRDELVEVVVEAWLARAPKRTARAWLTEHRPG